MNIFKRNKEEESLPANTIYGQGTGAGFGPLAEKTEEEIAAMIMGKPKLDREDKRKPVSETTIGTMLVNNTNALATSVQHIQHYENIKADAIEHLRQLYKTGEMATVAIDAMKADNVVTDEERERAEKIVTEFRSWSDYSVKIDG